MSRDAEPSPDILDVWHERRGAAWRELDTRRLVASYGDVESEVSLVREGCGAAEWRWIESFEVTGEDRHRFLNAYLTCDVAPLAPGGGVYGFFTSTQGRILSDAVVTAGEESLRVDVPVGRRAPLIEHLGRYVLADRVTLLPRAADPTWLLLGPLAEEVVSRWTRDLPAEPWSSVAGAVAGHEVAIRRDRPLGAPAFSLRTEAGAACAVADVLAATGAPAVGFDAVETLRIEAGVPRFGADFDESHFPQEVGFDDAVSYTKGCYLGQEVVARIHYRGHVNHELRGLRIDGDALPPAGARLEHEGQEVGHVGSVTRSSQVQEIVGLVIVHRKAAVVGTRVSLPDEVTARIEEPGFARIAAGSSFG